MILFIIHSVDAAYIPESSLHGTKTSAAY